MACCDVSRVGSRWRGAHGGQAEFESAVDEWEFHSLAETDLQADTIRLLHTSLADQIPSAADHGRDT